MTTFATESQETADQIGQKSNNVEQPSGARKVTKDRDLDPAEEGRLLAERLRKALEKIFADTSP